MHNVWIIHTGDDEGEDRIVSFIFVSRETVRATVFHVKQILRGIGGSHRAFSFSFHGECVIIETVNE